MLQVWTEPAIGEHIDFSPQQCGQVLLKTDDVQKRTSLLNFHKQIYVAVGVIVASCDRAKHTYVPGPVLRGQS